MVRKRWPTGRRVAAAVVLIGVALAVSAGIELVGAAERGLGLIPVATGCLVSGLVLLLDDTLQRRRNAVIDAMRSQESPFGKVAAEFGKGLGIAGQAARLGLAECWPDASIYDYTYVLCESRRAIILLNDGRTWISVHRDRLRRRLEDPSKETTVYLIHPDSEMVPVLAKKGSIDAEALRTRIWESITMLTELCNEGTKLEILGHELFNPYSMVLGEDRALLVPYFASRGGRAVPMFVFEDVGQDCYYRQLVTDMEGLRMDSQRLPANRWSGDESGRRVVELWGRAGDGR
jgi:hypothetical protein